MYGSAEITVSELNLTIADAIRKDLRLRNVTVKGEISGFRHHIASGHWYFSLKDAEASVSCVMFRQNTFRSQIRPKDGDSVAVTGYVDVYPRNGSCQLYVTGMRSAGLGDLYLRFEALKRPERFVETVGLLKARGRDVEGVMLGEGSLRKKVEEQVSSLGLERDVELIGFVKNPYPYIGGSDVLVVPSDTEGLSIVTLEALSIGVPVVSTNCTGPAGILKQGGGLLADMTAESLADKVERIMDDGDLRVRLEAEGPRVAEQYSPERVMNLFYDLVENGPERKSGSNT